MSSEQALEPNPAPQKTRAPSISSYSTASTLPVEAPHSVQSEDSSEPSAIPAMEQVQIMSGDWSADTETALRNVEEFKAKVAGAQHWREFKNDLKKYVALVKSDAAARKF